MQWRFYGLVIRLYPEHKPSKSNLRIATRIEIKMFIQVLHHQRIAGRQLADEVQFLVR